MKSNIALSYVLMLTIVGFFLWIIRGLVQSLRRNREDASSGTFQGSIDDQGTDDEQRRIDWPAQLFLSPADEIPLPGRLLAINPCGAFLETSAPLSHGQQISLYMEVPAQGQVRVSATVLWTRMAPTRHCKAQVRFEQLDPGKRAELFRRAGSRSMLVTQEESAGPRA